MASDNTELKAYLNLKVSLWTFTYKMEDQGLILSGLHHAGYSYAQDIRISQILIEYYDDVYNPNTNKVETTIKTKSMRLNKTDFEVVSNIEKVEYPVNINDEDRPKIYQFRKYPFQVGLKVKYKKNAPLWGVNGNADFDKIEIEQNYLFCAYTKTPAHEPGGILPAARFFPLLKFNFIANSAYKPADKDNLAAKRIKSIRADYRMHLKLDMFLKTDGKAQLDPSLVAEKGKGISEADIKNFQASKPNQATLVRDAEDIVLAPPSTAIVFYSVEKPLLTESCAFGLINGRSYSYSNYKTGSPSTGKFTNLNLYPYPTWDNIHWWGVSKGIKLTPSTPGAFHANHLHWRWPQVVQDPSDYQRFVISAANKVTGSKKFESGAVGEEQLKGINTNTGKTTEKYGGPLLDPAIPNQTYRIVVSKFDESKIEELPASWYFENFLNGNKGPSTISDGDNIVLNLSIQCYKRKETKTFGGTLFIHGTYFAHDKELEASPFYTTRGDDLNNGIRSSNKWFIFPKGTA